MKNLVKFLLCLSLLIFIISSIYSFKLSILLLLPALLILLISTVPLYATKDSNYFSPIAYLVYWIFLTVFIRMVYIIYDYPDSISINSLFLLGHDKLFLVKPLIIIIIGMVLFIFGYLLKPSKTYCLNSVVNIKNWKRSKIYIINTVILFISIISLVKFVFLNIESLVSLTLENISMHRGVSTELSSYSSNTFLRILIKLSEVSYYISFVYLILSSKKHKTMFMFLFISFVVSSFFYFYSQSRSGFLFLIINPFILTHLLKKNKITVTQILRILTVSLLLFYFISSFRLGTIFHESSFSISNIYKLVDPIIAHSGGFDISKTGLIMEYIDKSEDKQFGKSFGWIIFSFIPRSFWPNKPVNIDTYIGMKVYHTNSFGAGGIPPGVFSELYLNFGYFGIFLGCFIIGVILKWINNYFLIKGVNNINMIIIYVTCFMSIGVGIFGSSISSAIVGILHKLIPIIFILEFITDKKRFLQSKVTEAVCIRKSKVS
jgi:oligosaccharide repeat unit polymerase